MILLFGPSGAGKSVQGRRIADSQGWQWLSVGKLLRDKQDVTFQKEMDNGELVDTQKVNQIVGEALDKSADIKKVIIDGFPRQIEQARWLIQDCKTNNRTIDLIVVIDVPKADLINRLQLRGRSDDTVEVINERLRLYDEEILPILDYFIENKIPVAHINGALDVNHVYYEIIEELKKCNLV